jgi:alkanesulfonate monooxygenase SsuD/methylene tetrahydromethanopterin reductase-like flavin-dependent oxidoreductase (luciferase family)
LYEEICMLDHLSNGRFEFGVGRGASPHELAALGVDPSKAAKMYAEAFEIIQRCFSSGSVTFAGDFWNIEDYTVEMQPLQKPRPQMWYALASPDSAVWPAQQGMNVVCGGAVARVRAISDRYREEWSKTPHSAETEPLIGINRYVVVGDTDAEAREIGRKAWPTFYDNFIKLWRKHGTQPVNAKLPPEFDALLESGHAVAGSARTVRDQLGAQIADGGLNYLVGSFMFGNMPQTEALESVQRFVADVMPALREIQRVAA